MEYFVQDKGFKILINGKEIITHTVEKPWIYVGQGNGKFDMYRGNFKITDHLYEKMGLADFVTIRNDGGIKVTFSRNGLNALTVLFTEDEGRMVIRFINNPSDLNRLWLRLKAMKEEHIYGCGEQFSYLNLRGKNFPLWVSEQGVGRNKQTYVTFLADVQDRAGGDYYTTYYPEPTFISSRKYYLNALFRSEVFNPNK